MIAFGFSANAQSSLKLESETKSKEANSKEMAYGELRELSSVVELSPEQKNDFLTLFNMRNEALSNAKSDEEKATIYNRFGKKFLSGLTEEQTKKLSENKELYNKLTNLKHRKQ
ncbi:hypothetical protein M0M57_02500 [Flavobacterium azooxidireducens]|uniref:DUF4890 domain-containing protein n=1 Tax=Flavobacterium azooxidireducens TaxID=1871076 RepID=A0ABY4KFY1_9FLAO|nr:hypothetical protein [Flavobacterium azooxidireducens]UPQ79713.1 hypothetical protein M0M57_02500 [Flavobacterium azooxidireducens]